MVRSFIYSIALLLCATTTYAAKDIVIYGDEDYPPYSYFENGKMTGIYTAILKEAVKKVEGYNVEIKPIPWKRGVGMLKDGKAFALYPPYHHESRPFIWPYSLPIVNETAAVFCHKGILKDNPRPQWPEDYYGLTIGNNTGFALGGDKFKQALADGKIRLSEVKGTDNNLKKLAQKRVDCYMNDRLSILWTLKQMKEKGDYTQNNIVEGATISIEQGFVGYSDTNNSAYPYKLDFIKKLDFEIYKMRRSGELQKIIEGYTK
jgi:polar amino acid transport system substrate-binding protein